MPGATDLPDGLVVTFDLFSALLDSRSGGGTAFDVLARERGWPLTGTEVFVAWDRRHKEAQRTVQEWVPYAVPARRSLEETYAVLGLAGDAGDDLDRVLSGLGAWPLWPDVPAGLPALARRARVGLLSNVDDALVRRTRAAPLVDAEVALTSERLGAYKPSPLIYHRARERLGTMVHVASSARDVRGALEAGIPVVRLRRPGHEIDAEGPTPPVEVGSVADLTDVLPEVLRGADGQDRPSLR